MATKPVLTIDVDDSAFDRFTRLFNEYSDRLDEQPEAWNRLNDAMGGGADALRDGAMSAKDALALAGAQAVLISEELRNANKGMHELERSTETTHKGMKGLAGTAKSLGSTIFGIGKWITGIGIAALGLGAIGSGFGFGALASAALSRQRSANQLGLNPGELSSFQVNAQQFLDIGALHAAVETQADITKAGPLANLGIDFRRAQTLSPSDLAFEELKAARAAYLEDQRSHLPPMQDPRIQAYLGLGGQYGNVLNAAMQPLSALRTAQQDTRGGAGPYGFDPETAASWITLKKALDSAGITIETGLIKALAPLAPQIAALSKEVVGFIAAFLNSKEFAIVVEDVKTGLAALVEFLIKTDWKKIGDDIALVSAEVMAVAQKLSWLVPHDTRTPEEKAAFAEDDRRKVERLNAVKSAVTGAGSAIGSAVVAAGPWIANPMIEAAKWSAARQSGDTTTKAMLDAAKQFHVDPRLVMAEYRTEGGASAAKPFGLLAGTRGYGGVGYRGKDDSFAEFAKVNAASWASDIREMRAKGIPVTMESLIKYHEAWYTPVGAANDPTGLNANKIRNMMTDIAGNTGPPEPTAPPTPHPAASTAQKPHPALLKALRDRHPVKPAHVTIRDNTAGRVSIAINGAHW